jgi:formamidopyrimidine-DNA glycosylase
MPELPEVETVRRGLEPHMAGRRILSAEARRPDLRWPLPLDLNAKLAGRQVVKLDRRAKYILAVLDDGQTIILHLGMTGRLLVRQALETWAPGDFYNEIAPDNAHDHVIIRMDGADIVFNDVRRFGSLHLAAAGDLENHFLINKLGPEPLGNEFSGPSLWESLKGRKTPIKSALLDQTCVAGLGNIYVCEALHRSGISPRRKAASIGAARAEKLAAEIKTVLAEAIRYGGSTLKDFAHADGQSGGFQERFLVYAREGAACEKPGCGGVVSRIVQSGRSTFFCGACQR